MNGIVTNPAVFFPQWTEEERKFIGGRKTPTATRQDWIDRERRERSNLADALGLHELEPDVHNGNLAHGRGNR